MYPLQAPLSLRSATSVPGKSTLNYIDLMTKHLFMNGPVAQFAATKSSRLTASSLAKTRRKSDRSNYSERVTYLPTKSKKKTL